MWWVTMGGYENIPWLTGISNYENKIPVKKTPYVRTKHMNKKIDGCFICARKYNVTRHHIRKGNKPLAVFICRKHHDIIHGIALNKLYDRGKKKGQYYYSTADIRTVLAVAEKYKLFKHGEKGLVIKRIRLEIQRREAKRNSK